MKAMKTMKVGKRPAAAKQAAKRPAASQARYEQTTLPWEVTEERKARLHHLRNHTKAGDKAFSFQADTTTNKSSVLETRVGKHDPDARRLVYPFIRRQTLGVHVVLT